MATPTTETKLAAITDAGLFERLATAVLREINQEYRLLVHSGVNLEGKTVPSPVDGITIALDSDPPQMIAVHHTTCSSKELRGKWLSDPTDSETKSTTTPAGDLAKTAQEFAKQKARIPNLQGTLILTTNTEPPEDLVRDVAAEGISTGLVVTILARSALAHFLDYDPTGQWIRSRFLGIDQERLSDQLMHELSRQSLQLQNSQLPEHSQLWVDRELDRQLEQTATQDILFLVAESGFGKTIACHKRLAAHVNAGGFGLVLPHSRISQALSLEQAIDATLRDLHPSLSPGAGGEALRLASEQMPLLMVVEDVNRSEQPTSLLQRLASWSTQQSTTDSPPVLHWQVLCPVWPRLLTALPDQDRRTASRLVLEGSSFAPEEGTAAVRRRRHQSGNPITALEAEALAAALGHDPLLIALQDQDLPQAPDASSVIQDFVRNSLQRLSASHEQFTPEEYRLALRHLATTMLERRCFDFGMAQISDWVGNATQTAMLRHVVLSGEVLRIVRSPFTERVEFRHDRIRDWLLSDAAADLFRHHAMPHVVLADPYFSEIVGAALIAADIPLSAVEQTKLSNPLALFCAMALFGEPSNDLQAAALKAAEEWLDEEATHAPHHDFLRSEACRVLSECEASYVVPLVMRFQQEKDNWWALRALFRNGDLHAGIQLCLIAKPGIRAVGHLELIEHVQRSQSEVLVPRLCALLCRDELPGTVRSGALRLGGYLGTPALASGVRASWDTDTGRRERLDNYLWASAQCCHDDATLLEAVCEEWAALPDEPEEEGWMPPRDALVAHEIRWAFQSKLPDVAILHFIERAKTPALRWPITYLLHGIDHPYAVEFVAREFAAAENSSHLAMTVGDEWKWRVKRTGRAMSEASRNRLRKLWRNEQNCEDLRKMAFRMWCCSAVQQDLPLLRTASNDCQLEDRILFERLRLGDREAIPEFVVKLRHTSGPYWWQAGRYIWSDEITESLDTELTRRRDKVESKWVFRGESYPSDWILSEHLMERRTKKPEDLLLKHWDHLRYAPYYVSAALHLATPALQDLAAEAIGDCPNPGDLFKHFSIHIGVLTTNRVGITGVHQIQALIPYLQYFSDSDIGILWSECNRQGWFDFRRKHLDPLVGSESPQVLVDDSRATAALDKLLTRDGFFAAGLWADNFLETGVSVCHLMGVLRRWLEDQSETKALTIAAEIVFHVGRRSDLALLSSHGIHLPDQASPLVANACYGLKRKTLN